MKYIKSKIQFIVISSLLVVFSGCSNSAFKYFEKEKEFVQNAQYTKVLKVVEKDAVKAIANITYLNGADPKKWNNGKQNFIISKYITEEDGAPYSLILTIQQKKKIQVDSQKIKYDTLTLKPLEEKVIKKDDPLYSQIPFRNNWAEYKLVSYEDIKIQKHFSFTFKDSKNNSAKTTFTTE